MISILRILKNTVLAIMIIAAVWIILKKTDSKNTLSSGSGKPGEISGFDNVMIGLTELMETFYPSSPVSNQMRKQKEKILNQL